MSLGLVADLLAATSDAHTPRALVRAIATSLAAHVPVCRVELRAVQPIEVVERDESDPSSWRSVDAQPHPAAVVIAAGLAIVTGPPAGRPTPGGPASDRRPAGRRAAGRAPTGRRVSDGLAADRPAAGRPVSELPVSMTTPELRAALDQVLHAATRHLEVVRRIAELSRRAHAETRELRSDLQRNDSHGELVARSTAMREVVERARLVATHPTTVLVTGESGSGKELVARDIHRRSPRAHRPLLQLNCGALPEHLVDSELFGHERGAFTGADRQHVGMFERAHRGTLFLDEVGELPPAVQVKLLRVLQERTIRRVGGSDEIEVDVRLIAATNRSLTAMVVAGQFRDDLRYRLDVFAIHVPPLRDRRMDLAPLATALVARICARAGIVEPPPLTRSLLAKLAAYDWPGNVRELANVLETAVILGQGSVLELPEDLARRIEQRRSERVDAGADDTRSRFDHAMRVAIEDALRATRGKIYGDDGAAARLGLKPATLQSKMGRLGIHRGDFVSRS